jgi:hypothetical protein
MSDCEAAVLRMGGGWWTVGGVDNGAAVEADFENNKAVEADKK